VDRPRLEVEIPDLVEQRELLCELRCPVELVQDLDVELDGLLVLPLELELPGLVLRLFDVQRKPRQGWERKATPSN
jgi:hypothetical protein